MISEPHERVDHSAADTVDPSLRSYHDVAMMAPIVVAAGLVLLDLPQLDRLSVAGAAIAASVICLAAVQQALILLQDDHLSTPRSNRLPAWTLPLASVPARWVGTWLLIGVLFSGVRAGGLALVWVAPVAVSVSVFSLSAFRPSGLRRPATMPFTLSIGAAVGAVVAAIVAADPADPRAAAVVLLQTLGVLGVVVGLQGGQVWWFGVISELAAARQLAVAHAVTNERLRFAGELHDLQGLELQKILLQAELGQALLADNSEDALARTTNCLVTIRDTAAGALAQTRAIAHGYREVGIAQEVANVRGVLSAAGLDVTVRGHPNALGRTAAHLAGLTLRECATNILRHSEANAVSIEFSDPGSGPFSMKVTDGGPARSTAPGVEAGSGLSSLRTRATAEGFDLISQPLLEGWRVELRERR